MFKERGYTNIEKYEDKIIALKPDNKQICIFSKIIEKLNVSEMHNYISILQENKIEHGLIIFEGSPTSTVKNVIGNTPALGINIELFTADDLQFNITKHKLVPKHIRLSKEEAKQFKEKYGVNIPKLLRIDPVCRFYDFSTGDIIKIVRRDGFISFRIVR
jgi:DNA-directed RNA polymerase I, II, and III subunit RPABC1